MTIYVEPPAPQKKILGANFHQQWAGLAVLFSRQLLNGSQGFFFRFNILMFIYFLKYKTIETHARTFLPLNISAVGSVYCDLSMLQLKLQSKMDSMVDTLCW